MKRDIKLRDFVLNTENDSILTDFRYIENQLGQYVNLIVEADTQDLTYISITDHEEIVEIGWEYK